MEQTILTSDQKTVIRLLSEKQDLNSFFYLSGGTALSEFYVRHRYSDDLDFFTGEKNFPQFSVETFIEEIRNSIAAETSEYKRMHDRRIFFLKKGGSELKLEFTYYPFEQIHPPQEQHGIRIDSLEDIAANKLMALLDRIEAKDFVDLYFILNESSISLNTLLSFVKRKFHFGFDPVTLGSEFSKVKSITLLPDMIKPLTLPDLKTFFEEQAKKLGKEIFNI